MYIYNYYVHMIYLYIYIVLLYVYIHIIIHIDITCPMVRANHWQSMVNPEVALIGWDKRGKDVSLLFFFVVPNDIPAK